MEGETIPAGREGAQHTLAVYLGRVPSCCLRKQNWLQFSRRLLRRRCSSCARETGGWLRACLTCAWQWVSLQVSPTLENVLERSTHGGIHWPLPHEGSKTPQCRQCLGMPRVSTGRKWMQGVFKRVKSGRNATLKTAFRSVGCLPVLWALSAACCSRGLGGVPLPGLRI